MELHKLLQFTEVQLLELDFARSDNQKGVMVLSAPLTRDHAEVLGIDYLLNGSIVREGVGSSLPLSIELQNVTLHLPMATDLNQYTTYFPDTIHKLRLNRTEGGQFEISMRAHIPIGMGHEALALYIAIKKDLFEMAIRSRQGELFEGGTRVEMTKPAPTSDAGLFACPHCDADVPLTDDGTGHVVEDGEVIPCTHPSATAERAMKSSGSVASKREMAGVQ